MESIAFAGGWETFRTYQEQLIYSSSVFLTSASTPANHSLPANT